ncbi:hypothetical protein BDR04DRAFT_422705 [Suillus decipiens]|nr:hypothetical protein BDR04DRAFT_422705 [Suillus decipiens]
MYSMQVHIYYARQALQHSYILNICIVLLVFACFSTFVSGGLMMHLRCIQPAMLWNGTYLQILRCPLHRKRIRAFLSCAHHIQESCEYPTRMHFGLCGLYCGLCRQETLRHLTNKKRRRRLRNQKSRDVII